MNRRRFNLGLLHSTAGMLLGCKTILRSTEKQFSTPIDAVPPLEVSTPYGLNHVLVTGQSLSTGLSGAPVLSTAQPYANRMFQAGARLVPDGSSDSAAPASAFASLQPLVEAAFKSGGEVYGETICSGFANRTTARIDPKEGPGAFLMDVNGLSGAPYATIASGSDVYGNGIEAAQAATSLYAQTGAATYGVCAVIAIHGETDEAFANTGYTADLLQWQTDYDRDLRAITGQSAAIPLQICQVASSWDDSSGRTNIIPQQQVDAARQNPGRIILACPKYMLPYNLADVHLTNVGYRWLGEYHSRAFEYLLQGRQWQPLWPTGVAGVGSTQLLVDFYVPVAPLVIDTELVSEPTSIPGQRYGFEIFNPNGEGLTITEIDLFGSSGTQLLITFSGTLAAGARLRYAYSRPTQNGHAGIAGPSGDYAGNRGNLRDSDSSPSLYGNPLFNWCVIFDMAIG